MSEQTCEWCAKNVPVQDGYHVHVGEASDENWKYKCTASSPVAAKAEPPLTEEAIREWRDRWMQQNTPVLRVGIGASMDGIEKMLRDFAAQFGRGV